MQISSVSNGYSKVAFGFSTNPTEQLNPETVARPQAYPAATGAQGLEDEPKKGGFWKTVGWTALGVAVVTTALGLLRKFGLKADINQYSGIKKGLAVAGEWINKNASKAWNAVKGLFTKKPPVETPAESMTIPSSVAEEAMNATRKGASGAAAGASGAAAGAGEAAAGAGEAAAGAGEAAAAAV